MQTMQTSLTITAKSKSMRIVIYVCILVKCAIHYPTSFITLVKHFKSFISRINL